MHLPNVITANRRPTSLPSAQRLLTTHDHTIPVRPAQIGGTLAAVGQRLIDGTSEMMIKRFFEKLAEGRV